MNKCRSQRGAVAIEFAMVLPMFIAIFYALVSYALVVMLLLGFNYAAEDSLRAAIAVDCSGLNPGQCASQRITPAVREQVSSSLSWLPEDIQQKVLGTGGQNVNVSCANETCTVEIRFDGYRTAAPLPAIELPFIGTVPRLPQDLVGRASLRI